jgi:hypothetical protein
MSQQDDGLFAQIFSLPWSNTFTMSGKKEAFATNLHFLKNGNHRPEHTILLQNPTQDFKWNKYLNFSSAVVFRLIFQGWNEQFTMFCVCYGFFLSLKKLKDFPPLPASVGG